MASHISKYPFFAPPSRPAGPYLPIKIKNPLTNKEIEWYCLIDTGADTCLFNGEIAEMLGHDLKGEGVKSSVSTGVDAVPIRTYMHTFILSLMHPTIQNKVVWKGKKRLFECIDNNKCPLLLGIDDFLRYFRLSIDFKQQMTSLQWKS